METSRILKSGSEGSGFRGKILLGFIWLLILGLFGLYGFFGPGYSAAQSGGVFHRDVAIEVMMFFFSLGAGAATAVVIGLSGINAFRKFRLKRGVPLTKAFVGAIVAPFVSGFAALFCRIIGFWEGEYQDAMVALIIVWTVGIAVGWFLLCLVVVLAIDRDHRQL